MSFYIEITVTTNGVKEVFKFRRRNDPPELAMEFKDLATVGQQNPSLYETAHGAHQTRNRVITAVARIVRRKKLGGTCTFTVETQPSKMLSGDAVCFNANRGMKVSGEARV